MNKVILGLMLLLPASWTQISKKNSALDQAEEAYKKADYEASVRAHLDLITNYELEGQEAAYDLALSYQLNGQEEEAKTKFTELLSSPNPLIASSSANQQGVMLGSEKKYKEALEAFKTALIKDPTNEIARYNYELLARWLENNEDQNQEENQNEQDQQEPSNYAKRMKAEADKLVDQFKFGEAFELMNKALEIDETVSHYQSFIKNLGDINEINEQ
ncbi:hypothetical protein GCM10007049_25810 [Echinicola pacifica]|uniref:Tetratricopeptide repeat-containing protein n=1 Tax=Echinicola pacifica TaxID=346377 RepID=A0A918USP2_9BACT|nr:tetratricopeptide repeat domain protein [Echinicola pacifica]GGZ31479.1 hypothetical protein GCM10007049_25810 [Echinicola pacifica]